MDQTKAHNDNSATRQKPPILKKHNPPSVCATAMIINTRLCRSCTPSTPMAGCHPLPVPAPRCRNWEWPHVHPPAPRTATGRVRCLQIQSVPCHSHLKQRRAVKNSRPPRRCSRSPWPSVERLVDVTPPVSPPPPSSPLSTAAISKWGAHEPSDQASAVQIASRRKRRSHGSFCRKDPLN